MSTQKNDDSESDVDLDTESIIDDFNPDVKKADIVFRDLSSNTQTKKHIYTAVVRSLYTRQCWNYIKPFVGDFIVFQRIPSWYIFNGILINLYNAESLVISELKEFLEEFIFIVDSNRFTFVLELMMFSLVKPEKIFLEMKPHIKELRIRVERSRDALLRRTNEPLSASYDLLQRIYILYENYLDFVDWNMLVEDNKRQSQQSIQRDYSQSTFNDEVSDRISSTILENLLRILEGENPPEMNLDIIPLTLLQIYEHRSEMDQAKLMFENYAENYRDHLNANVYLYEFIKNHPELLSVEEFKEKRRWVLRNIVRICPDSRYSLRFASLSSEESGIPCFERIHILANFVDYVRNRRSIKAWRLLTNVLKEYSPLDQEEFEMLENFFKFRFSYWKKLHFIWSEIIEFRDNLIKIKKSSPMVSESETGFSSTSFINDKDDETYSRIISSNNSTNLTKEEFILIRNKLKFLEVYRHHFGTMILHLEDYFRVGSLQ